MEQLQLVRQKVVELLGEVEDVEDDVVRAERIYDGKCYAIAYVDLADNVVGRASELQNFQERIIGDDFFGAPGDLRWNKYLYIVAGPKSLEDAGFENAKALIESDKDYARKRVVSEEELQSLLSAAQHFKENEAGRDVNVVREWEKRLSAAELDELLDRPARKTVVERIGTRSAKRVPVAEKTLTLKADDVALARKWLAGISIDKFRAVHDGRSYSFGQVTLIVGPNGTGKTSLLEAIEYFYCGHNRRQGNSIAPEISGTLVGNPNPLSSPVESGRIRARCFSWYNRDERLARSILGAFTRYNFLDTDAAFRLSTELEPSEIPDDLSRLLVGADASVTWDYLTKLTPDVETAYERAILKVSEYQQKLMGSQKELDDLQNRASNGKSLTDMFRAALDGLRWKSLRASAPLVTADEANGLHDAIGHIQALLAAGSSAVSLTAISARDEEIELAIARARPLDNERVRLAQEARQHAEQALACERASELLERWLTYLNSGFDAAHARIKKAKTAANVALGALGIYANGDIPVVPEEYAAIALESALRTVNIEVENAAAQVTSLEQLSAKFGAAASARAQVARQLRAAAEASFDSGHPKDDCPICRAKYSPNDLAAFVDQITSSLENPSELTDVAAQIVEARKRHAHVKGVLASLLLLKRFVDAVSLSIDVVCSAIPMKLADLRSELTKANSESDAAAKDWEHLANSGLTTNEYDLLRDQISSNHSALNGERDSTVIEGARSQQIESAADCRKKEAECFEKMKRVSEQLAEISAAALADGWETWAQPDGGMQSLLLMQKEIASLQSRADALLGLMDCDRSVSLSELSVSVVGAARIHSEAIQAVQIDSVNSQRVSKLAESIQELKEQVLSSSERAQNYLAALQTLKLLLDDCSLERATQESLDAIGSEINEIFSRIHAPNEYEYVGRNEMLLQSAATGEKRTLEQVSTGQRAAFALSVFLGMNRSATSAPPVILIDDPIAHIDDLNALSFLDYLRDLAVNSNRQLFFSTADTRIASLFTRKFGFLGESFKTIQLTRERQLSHPVS